MTLVDGPDHALAYAMAVTFLSVAAADHNMAKFDLDKFQSEVTNYLKAPTTRDHLNADIKRLSEIVMSIESCFANIYHQMRRIDNKKLLSDQGGLSIEFAPKWKALHDEYSSLMVESQLTATKISSKIDDLLRVILPIVESDIALDIRQGSLDEYIQSLELFQAEGQKNATRFLRLRNDVEAFRRTVKETIIDNRDDLGKKVKQLDKKIAKLQADLESSSEIFVAFLDVLKLSAPGVVASAGVAMQAFGVANSVAGISGLSSLAPAIGIAILVIGFLSFGFSITKGIRERAEQRKAKMKELVDLQEEREDTAFKAHQLKSVLELMRVLDTDFNQMVSRLSSIQGIWNMLVTDAQRLSHLLSVKTGDNTRGFKLATEGVAATYEILQFALKQYSLAVAK